MSYSWQESTTCGTLQLDIHPLNKTVSVKVVVARRAHGINLGYELRVETAVYG